ncbi:MAG: serine/threonine-protein kinase [Polyangiales bacterium]
MMGSLAHAKLLRTCRERVGNVVDGKYRLEEFIGAGTTGAVYRAVNTWAGREVAVKLFHYEGDKADTAMQRFVREAQAANRVRKEGRPHPNVVDALDVGRDGPSGLLFLVQEFLRGVTLDAYLDALPEHRVAAADAVFLLLPIVDAIACAHEAGVVHRDLKPENIFLVTNGDDDPIPKVLDFGIAQLNDARMTSSHELMGTPLYMAPESFFGASHVDARADVWALGVILFEMIAGRAPFNTDDGNPMTLISILATQDPPSLAAEGLMRPNAWAVLARCFARHPGDRYPHARALKDALEAVFDRF